MTTKAAPSVNPEFFNLYEIPAVAKWAIKKDLLGYEVEDFEVDGDIPELEDGKYTYESWSFIGWFSRKPSDFSKQIFVGNHEYMVTIRVTGGHHHGEKYRVGIFFHLAKPVGE